MTSYKNARQQHLGKMLTRLQQHAYPLVWRRTATESASPQAVPDLVGRLQDDRADAPAPQVAADGT